VLANCATRSLEYLSKDPRLIGIPMDGSVLLFALGAALATSVLFGIVPAVQATRVDTGEALKQGGSRRVEVHGEPLRVNCWCGRDGALPGAAGVRGTAAEKLRAGDARGSGLSNATVSDGASYAAGFLSHRCGGYAILHAPSRKVERAAGVVGASASSHLPIEPSFGTGDIHIEGQAMAPGEAPGASFQRALPNYFHVMGIPLLRGRSSTSTTTGRASTSSSSTRASRGVSGRMKIRWESESE